MHSVSKTPSFLGRTDIFGIHAWIPCLETWFPVPALEVDYCVTLGMCSHLSDPLFSHLGTWPVSLWTHLALLLFRFISSLSYLGVKKCPAPLLPFWFPCRPFILRMFCGSQLRGWDLPPIPRIMLRLFLPFTCLSFLPNSEMMFMQLRGPILLSSL